MSRDRYAWKPNAAALIRRIALSARGRLSRRHGEPVDAVSVADQRLQLVEVHPDAVLGARHFRRVGAPLHERRHDDGIAGAAGRRATVRAGRRP